MYIYIIFNRFDSFTCKVENSGNKTFRLKLFAFFPIYNVQRQFRNISNVGKITKYSSFFFNSFYFIFLLFRNQSISRGKIKQKFPPFRLFLFCKLVKRRKKEKTKIFRKFAYFFPLRRGRTMFREYVWKSFERLNKYLSSFLTARREQQFSICWSVKRSNQ